MLPYLWAATNARDAWRRMPITFSALSGVKRDLTLAEICDRLERVRGEKVSPSMIWRFFDRHDITLKKSLRTRASRTARTSGNGDGNGLPANSTLIR